MRYERLVTGMCFLAFFWGGPHVSRDRSSTQQLTAFARIIRFCPPDYAISHACLNIQGTTLTGWVGAPWLLNRQPPPLDQGNRQALHMILSRPGPTTPSDGDRQVRVCMTNLYIHRSECENSDQEPRIYSRHRGLRCWQPRAKASPCNRRQARPAIVLFLDAASQRQVDRIRRFSSSLWHERFVACTWNRVSLITLRSKLVSSRNMKQKRPPRFAYRSQHHALCGLRTGYTRASRPRTTSRHRPTKPSYRHHLLYPDRAPWQSAGRPAPHHLNPPTRARIAHFRLCTVLLGNYSLQPGCTHPARVRMRRVERGRAPILPKHERDNDSKQADRRAKAWRKRRAKKKLTLAAIDPTSFGCDRLMLAFVERILIGQRQ